MINGDDFEFVLTFGKRFLSPSVTTDGSEVGDMRAEL